MSVVTIPRKLVEKDDLVVVSRKEYEKLFRFWASAEQMTKWEKQTVERGLREIARGKIFTSQQVKYELGL